MKIILNDYNLASGESEHESPQNLKIVSKHEVQVFKALRADFVKTIGRGNVQTQISFDVNKRHNSQAEAELYALNHVFNVMNETGCLKIYIEDNNQSLVELQNASVLNVSASFKNNASFIAYTIIGGKMIAT